MHQDVLLERLTRKIEETLLTESDYRGEHTAPSKDDAPLHDLTEVYGDDIYSSQAVRYFGHGHPGDRASVAVIWSCRDKPNKLVKIFRAVPKVITSYEKLEFYKKHLEYVLKNNKLPREVTNWRNPSEYREFLSGEIADLEKSGISKEEVVIREGDWVSINLPYAKSHGESHLDNSYRILTKTVKAKELFNDGNSIHEFGYNP